MVHKSKVVPDEKEFTENVLLDFTHQELSRIKGGLEEYIVGQPRAIEEAIGALTRYFAGHKHPDRPIAALMFPGPSGSGKTYFAKTLAWLFLGGTPNEGECPATVIRCSEFQEHHMLTRLVGAPPSYIGHYNPEDRHSASGTKPLLLQSEIDKYDRKLMAQTLDAAIMRLIDALNPMSKEEANRLEAFAEKLVGEVQKRFRPRSVIIFDELERAHSALWQVLLDIIWEGQLQLQVGGNENVTAFQNSLIIMTSNIGERLLAQYLRSGKKLGMGFPLSTLQSKEKTDQEIYEIVRDEARKTFPVPLLGRIGGGFIPFRPLTRDNLFAILDLALRRLQKLYDGTKPEHPVVLLRFSDSVKIWLVERGIDAEYGARDLENKIQEHIVDRLLSRAELAGDLLPGDTVLFVLEEGKPALKRLPRRPSQPSQPTGGAPPPKTPKAGGPDLHGYIESQCGTFCARTLEKRAQQTQQQPTPPPEPPTPSRNITKPSSRVVKVKLRRRTVLDDIEEGVIIPLGQWFARLINGRER